jgi:hypothetical protein
MAVMAVSSTEEPQVELVDGELHARRLSLAGTIVEVAHDLELQDDPTGLARLIAETVEVGSTIIRYGHNQALVDSVALEIDRLIETAVGESEKLPQALEEPLGEHLTQLADLLARHFDPQRTRSLQAQIKTLVGETTGGELRKQLHDLLGADGVVGAQVRQFVGANADLLTRVNTLLGKIEQKLQLEDEVERSVHKGRPFEEVVQAELESIHGPLGDMVRCVRSDYGLLAKTGKGAKAGDYMVVLNPEHTRGREVSYVVEAKTGPLRAADAKRELEAAIANRAAAAGVLVYDGIHDAPLGGRCFMPHGDGRFTAVLDVENGAPLAFEVACREARLVALASVRPDGELDKGWVLAECDRLCEIVEEASAILGSVSKIERGATDVRERYAQMRLKALDLIDGLRSRAEE